MKMKRILSLCLVLCLAAIALIGGTLAYFTDTEYVENTMVSGKIDIEQKEWLRDGSAFDPDAEHVLIPAVVYNATGDLNPDAWESWAPQTTASTLTFNNDTVSVKMPDTTLIANVVDKIVTVENTGKNNAYVRTILVMSCDTEAVLDQVTFQYDTNVIPDGYKTDTKVTINENGNDKTYRVVVLTYADILEPGEAEASLMALWMNPKYTPEQAALATLNVEVYSQAVQSDGFREGATAAETALNAAFGAVNIDNLNSWLSTFRAANP